MTMSTLSNFEFALTASTLLFAFIVTQASSQSSDVTDLNPVDIKLVEMPEHRCGNGRFECRNGGCIDVEFTCDGRIDCSDLSDETISLCSSPNRICRKGEFRCAYGACAPEGSTCDGIRDCFDNSDELLDECPKPLRHTSLLVTLFDVKNDAFISALRHQIAKGTSLGGQTTSTLATDSLILKPSTISSTSEALNITTTTSSAALPNAFCLAPAQPKNGEWRFSQDIGPEGEPKDWEIPEGVQLPVDSVLKYNCRPGFELYEASIISTCLANGTWSSTPVCSEMPIPERVDDTDDDDN